VGSDNVEKTKPAQEVADSPNKPSGDGGSFPAGTFGKTDSTHPNEKPSGSKDSENVFQQVGAPTATVMLIGRALRLGHPIPTPKLDKVGDQETVQMGQWVREWQITVTAGIPIFAKIWRVWYEFKKPPDKIPVLGNPAFQLAPIKPEMLGD
jgi:hypothetical protein